MDLLLSTNDLSRQGGSETYLTTVAHELIRLGHGVTLHGNRVDPGALASLRGLRVVEGEAALPAACDAIVVQDAVCSYELAARYPAVPQLFVAHSEYHELQLPPQLPGIVAAAVALNDRVEARLEALALVPEVVRLRQPVDRNLFFVPDRGLPERPHRLLALGTRLGGARAAALERACEARGIDFERTPSTGTSTDEVPDAIARADVVAGYGRCILEAMAMGRAAYVWDHLGGDGWVTAGSYPALEADGFAGHGVDEPVDPKQLAADLDRFEPAMGHVNRDLVELHHDPARHTQELVGVLRGCGAAEREPGPFQELSRLSLTQWRMESRELALARDVEALGEELHGSRRREAEAVRRVRELERALHGGAARRHRRLARRLGARLRRIRSRRP